MIEERQGIVPAEKSRAGFREMAQVHAAWIERRPFGSRRWLARFGGNPGGFGLSQLLNVGRDEGSDLRLGGQLSEMAINRFRHVAEDGVGLVTGKIDRNTLAVARNHLPIRQPAMGLPRAFADQHWNEEHSVLFLTFDQVGHFFLGDEARG